MTCWLCGEATTSVETPTCKKVGPCQLCRRIAEVNEEINEAGAVLRRLVAKRRNLRSEWNRTHDPILRLPVELSNCIFQLLRPRRTEWGELVRTNNVVMPTYLASISRGWRDIAWSNPSLWSTMHIVIGGIFPSSSFMRDWILRSRTSPLTLHVDVRSRVWGLETEPQLVLDTISQCFSRCHSLSLDIGHDQLLAFHHRNFQYHHLRKLRVFTHPGIINQPIPLFNPKVSPEKLELMNVSLQSLNISCNHLTSATLHNYHFADIIPFFQHASRMTYCQILFPRFGGSYLSITHHRLKSLCLLYVVRSGATAFLGCLTLPSLQEFQTNELVHLIPENLPALVHRSSCPLTRITLCENLGGSDFHALQPIPRVTELVLEDVDNHNVIAKLLFQGYFPDLLHLTLRLRPFQFLWENGTISWLLDRKRRRPDSDALNEGRLDKLLVEDERRASEIDAMWNSEDGKKLKGLNISLREDGFEFL